MTGTTTEFLEIVAGAVAHVDLLRPPPPGHYTTALNRAVPGKSSTDLRLPAAGVPHLRLQPPTECRRKPRGVDDARGLHRIDSQKGPVQAPQRLAGLRMRPASSRLLRPPPRSASCSAAVWVSVSISTSIHSPLRGVTAPLFLGGRAVVEHVVAGRRREVVVEVAGPAIEAREDLPLEGLINRPSFGRATRGDGVRGRSLHDHEAHLVPQGLQKAGRMEACRPDRAPTVSNAHGLAWTHTS